MLEPITNSLSAADWVHPWTRCSLLGSGLLSARDRLEQRLKVSLAEAPCPSALDELEEEWPGPLIAEERAEWLHEDLQQVPLTRLGVDQHAQRSQPIQVVREPAHSTPRQTLVQIIVVAPRRTQEPRRVQLFHHCTDVPHVQCHVLNSRSAVVTNEASHLRSTKVWPKGLVQSEGDARHRTSHHYRTHSRSHLPTHALAMRARVELELPDLLEAHHGLEPPHHRRQREEMAGEVVKAAIARLVLQVADASPSFDEPEGHVADGGGDVHPAAVDGFVDVRCERCPPLREVLGHVRHVVDNECDLPQPVGVLGQKLRRCTVGRNRLRATHIAGSRTEDAVIVGKSHPVQQTGVTRLLANIEVQGVNALDSECHLPDAPFLSLRRLLFFSARTPAAPAGMPPAGNDETAGVSPGRAQ